MGVALIIDGADFSSSPSGLILPADADALLYANFFGEAASTQSRNLAPGRPGGLVTGAIVPTPNNQAGRFNAANFVDTGVLDQDAATLIAVARQSALADGTFGYAIGTYTDARNGTNILFSNETGHSSYSLIGYTGSNDSSQTFALGASPSTQFAFLCLRTSSAYGLSYNNKTGAGAPGPYCCRAPGGLRCRVF